MVAFRGREIIYWSRAQGIEEVFTEQSPDDISAGKKGVCDINAPRPKLFRVPTATPAFP